MIGVGAQFIMFYSFNGSASKEDRGGKSGVFFDSVLWFFYLVNSRCGNGEVWFGSRGIG